MTKNNQAKHTIKDLPYAYDKLQGISKEQITFHHDTHYVGYVKKRNEVETALQTVDLTTANANYSQFSELKRRESFNGAGQILHEIYFDVMGGDGKADPHLHVVKRIVEDFGSFENWQKEFIACGMSSFGWAVLSLDTNDNTLRNYIGDMHHHGCVWGSIPLIPMDLYEHAFYHDQGPNKKAYIEAFLNNLDWKKIDKRYQKASKAC
ncbi:MAG: Fe-Mn family superoxide dismutase [Candidatus Woesearchaeota archaeon]